MLAAGKVAFPKVAGLASLREAARGGLSLPSPPLCVAVPDSRERRTVGGLLRGLCPLVGRASGEEARPRSSRHVTPAFANSGL